MGAEIFECMSFGKDVREAFENAKQFARDCHGHCEGYSGDIQTKDDYVILDGVGNNRSVISNYFDTTNKFDPAGAIIINGEEAELYKAAINRSEEDGVVVVFFGWGSS